MRFRVNRASNANPVLVMGIFFIVGILTCIIAIVIGINQNKLKARCTAEVTAIVIENVEKKDTDDDGGTSITYAPVFSYNYNNRDYMRQSSVSSNPPKYSVGEQTVLMINPDKPEEYYNSDGQFGIVIIAILGIVFVIIGGFGTIPIIILLIKQRKQ